MASKSGKPSSATVGFLALSDLARLLEHVLGHLQPLASGACVHATPLLAAAEDIRRVLHQFAAGFLKQPEPQVIDDLKALQALDEGNDRAPMYVSLAKAKAGEVAILASNEGVQMHGGIGMTDEYDIGLYMKRDRALNEFLGDSYFHADRVARINGY